MSPRHSVSLLLLVLLGQLLLLIAQLPGRGSGGTRLERWALRVVSPVAALVTRTRDLASDVGEGLRTRHHLQEENRLLRGEVEALRRTVLLQQDAVNDLRRLQDAVRYVRANEGIQILVADVVFSEHRSWLKSLVLYLGADAEEVATNCPVVTGRGLVGRVVSVAGPYAKVQLVTDRSSAVGAMLEGSRRQGVVRGVAGGLLEMDYVPRQETVEIGDSVVTAGIDGVFPRGISIGTVLTVEAGSDLFHRIVVVPSVELGSLDHAYVLLPPSTPAQTWEGDAP